MQAQTLLVLSGGLDSSVLAHRLIADNIKVRTIYFDIGYKPRIPEKNSAKMVSYQLNIPFEIVDVSGIFGMVSGFVPIELLGLGELDKGQPTPIPIAVESDYVSGFYVILSLASYYAMLGKIPHIATGLIKEQAIYNTELPTFLEKWADTVNTINVNKKVEISNPLLGMSKAEVIKMGVSLGVDLRITWSCYTEGPLHCGTCPGCISRKQGFAAASVNDLTNYRL
jgi:7-cyano-7-deazaguanine synthase